MLIQSKVKDHPVTLITMQDNTRYAFEPNEAGDYVAEIENHKHIERLLAIPEGFCIYNSGEVISEADARAALEAAEAEKAAAAEAEARAAGEAAAAEAAAAAQGAGDTIPLEAMTETDLKALYEAELGRKPHWNAAMPTLIEHITAHRAAQE